VAATAKELSMRICSSTDFGKKEVWTLGHATGKRCHEENLGKMSDTETILNELLTLTN
jgi:hypothetical protein